MEKKKDERRLAEKQARDARRYANKMYAKTIAEMDPDSKVGTDVDAAAPDMLRRYSRGFFS